MPGRGAHERGDYESCRFGGWLGGSGFPIRWAAAACRDGRRFPVRLFRGRGGGGREGEETHARTHAPGTCGAVQTVAGVKDAGLTWGLGPPVGVGMGVE